MKTSLPRAITASEIAAYDRDGVVCLRGLFDRGWIARLEAAVDRLRDAPGPLGETYSADGANRLFYGDRFMWTFDPDFAALALESPAGAIIGGLMQSRQVRLYCDHLLVKEPGATMPTPWHHDQQAWPLEGSQICSLWLSLDTVTRDSGAVEYIAGSHRWGRRFRAEPMGRPADNFGQEDGDEEEFEPCPDFGKERDKHRFLCWDMAPGDCVVFHALTVHAAGGNATAGRRRRGIACRWVGDDVVWTPRRGKTATLIREPGLRAGDTLDKSDLFPVAWSRAA